MITRSDLQKMLRAVAAGECDGFLFIESTDRLSRDAADLHTLYKLLTFHRVRIFTVEEGEVTDMVIGLKAAMNAQYLKALGQKSLRGQIGVFLRGKWPSGAPFGYRFDRSQLEQDRKTGQMVPQRGVLEIDPMTAPIVVQMFEWYDAGLSGEAIAKRLNALGIDAPSSKPEKKIKWGPSTINGNWRRGTGILNNTIYVGRATYNRQRFEKDPTHVPAQGKKPRRRATPKDVSELEHVAVPHLRIIDDEVWQRVKERQHAGRRQLKVSDGRIVRNRRPVTSRRLSTRSLPATRARN